MPAPVELSAIAMTFPPHDIERAKQRAALVSVAVKVMLTLAKFAAAAVSGSLALFSEAANNLGDVGVTLLSFYSIRVAAKPADDDHQFGHGKVEALSALIQTGFLVALAVFILIEAAKRFLGGAEDVEPNAFAFGVLTVSIVVDAVRWVGLAKVAKATRSPALAADALNFATDIVASLLALAGLLAAAYGYKLGDAAAAVGVALFVGVAGFRLGKRTVGTLIDAAPKGLTAKVREAVGNVPGVIAVGAIRLRPVGNDIVGDVAISVSRTISVERLAAIRSGAAAAAEAESADLKIIVTADPIALDDETIVERVQYIANRRFVPIHHVTVQTLEGRQSVSFDAEVDGRMPLGRAHEVVTALEGAIADELGGHFEVESHIEPLEAAELDGQDCPETVRSEVRDALLRRIKQTGTLCDVHEVRVRETRAGLVVNYHCLVDPALSVDAVHAQVDALDRQVRQDCPRIVRIIGHAEPLKARDHA